MQYHYTYLIENLINNKKYIGVRSTNVIPEMDDYWGSSVILTNEIKIQGVGKFNKMIIEEWKSRAVANAHEEWLHGYINVAAHSEYYNLKNAAAEFYVTPGSTAKGLKTKSSPKWIEEVGNPSRKKGDINRKITFNDPQWINTRGKVKAQKISKTKLDPEWKEYIGKNQKRRFKETVSSKEYKEGIGKQSQEQARKTKLKKYGDATYSNREKASETVNDPIWKASVGAEKKRKEKIIKSDPLWIKENTFTCNHCGKSMVGKGNYNRWHNDNCKEFISCL